jgi:hypothetical protein
MKKSMIKFVFVIFISFFFSNACYSQKGFKKVQYFANDTNFIVTQFEKELKIKGKSLEKEITNNRKKFGIIEGTIQALDGDLLICATNFLDSTQKFTVIGKCVSSPCNSEKDGVDCDVCIPINFKLLVPLDNFYLITVSQLNYSSNDTVSLKEALISNNLSNKAGSLRMRYYSLYDYLNIYDSPDFLKFKRKLTDYVMPIFINSKNHKIKMLW